MFRLWASGCAHVGTDLRFGRESLAEAIRQSERAGPKAGPRSSGTSPCTWATSPGARSPRRTTEGREVVRQLGALRRHRREDVYTLVGNHDASGPDEPERAQWWFKKWIDPTGESTATSGVDRARMRYPVDGTWERYAFRVGQPALPGDGRPQRRRPAGRARPRGGYPAGRGHRGDVRLVARAVEANPDCVIVSAHHHMLKETTVASGPWEGYVKDEQGSWQGHYHGYFPDGGPGGGLLPLLRGRPPGRAGVRAATWRRAPRAPSTLWLGGHTHTHPDDRTGGRSHVERKWGVTFVNCAALSRHHGRTNVPMSRLFTFAEGSAEVRVQCYLHTADYAPQGWYAPAERTVDLGRPVRLPERPAL